MALDNSAFAALIAKSTADVRDLIARRRQQNEADRIAKWVDSLQELRDRLNGMHSDLSSRKGLNR